MPDPIRLVGINFDHQHMGDLLRPCRDHPEVEIVGVWHTERTRPEETLKVLELPPDLIYDDFEACMTQCRPDAAVLCSSTGTHADYTEKIAPYGVHLIVEKPFSATLQEADRMIAAMEPTGKKFAINWPLAWYPPHRTAKRLIDEGVIGDVIEVHYYDGNRGPLSHKMDKLAVNPAQQLEEKKRSWFYKVDQGGGSLLDYMGYGVTLGTWFNGGRKPIEVTCTTFASPGLEVDEHAVAVARYAEGLSKFETRWGTFTSPWVNQPQPKCGFVVCGTEGTIASYDYESTIRVQTRDNVAGAEVLVDELVPPYTGPIDYFIDCILHDRPIEGPLSPEVCRIGQQIVDTAFASAQQKKTLPLIER
ncbi:MAG: Gfo/Idh/MocA family oxidoreductase [Planctomycetota bacterium]